MIENVVRVVDNHRVNAYPPSDDVRTSLSVPQTEKNNGVPVLDTAEPQ